MATQDLNSPTPAWKCSNGHAEFENSQYQCKYCPRTYDDYLKDHRKIKTGQRILLFSSITALAVGLSVIWTGLYVRQKFVEADRAISQFKKTNTQLEQVNLQLDKGKKKLEKVQKELQRVPELKNLLKVTHTELELTITKLKTTQSNLEQTKATLTQTKNQLKLRGQQVVEGRKCLKLMREINHIISQGAGLNPAEVMKIQQSLQSLGFYQGKIDGKFAEITVKAVNDFQQNCEAELAQN